MCRQGLIVLLLLPVILAIDFDNNFDKPPLVKTRFGSILGKWSRSSKGLYVANFLGIPYAEPPVDDLRFREPKAWNRSWDILKAQSDGSPCIQLIKINTIIGSEDCLYLNVFVPMNRPDVKHSKLPVLVYVYGGAFFKGSGNSKNFPPIYWADQQVILVVFNYRLGPFGFFSLGNSIATGNYGLKDMVMVLKWVQENIESFGGDKNSVTLMGGSSGAASVHILALSRKTEGLFNKYILHSGTALAPWAVRTKHKMREISENMANSLSCSDLFGTNNSLNNNTIINDYINNNNNNNNNNIKEKWNIQNSKDMSLKKDLETIKCMRSYDAVSILTALSYYYSQHEYPRCLFIPTIEDESNDAILTMHPIEILEKKLFRDIPSIMGVVNDEGLVNTYDFYTSSDKLKIFTDKFDTILPKFLELPYVINNVDGFVKTIKDFYFRNNSINSQLQKITDLTGDGIFSWSMYKTVNCLSNVMKSNIYFYYFNYFGTFSKRPIFNFTGISHSDDIKYFFPPEYELSSNIKNDTIMIHVLMELWSNFMRKGVPSTWSEPNWPAYRNNHEFMIFNGNQKVNITIENKFLTDRMEFWNRLMYDYSDQFPIWYLDNEKMNYIEQRNGGYQLQTIKYVYFLNIFTTILISIYRY